MQEHKRSQNKALTFLAAHARRTGQSLEDLLKRKGLSAYAHRLSSEMQQSEEDHLGTDTTASPGVSVGPPPSDTPVPLDTTVASRRSVQDVMTEYRREERRRRWRARVLRAYGLDPEGRDATARLARLLLDLALDVALRRYGGLARRVTVATLMLPAELLAAHLGVRRETVWRALTKLKGAGLVDARAWRTTSKGETRAAGTLFAVRLKPGRRAQLTYDEFKHPWRDLDGDRARGRTAWAWIRAKRRPGYDVLLAWALGERVAPGEQPPPLPSLYDVYALPGMLPHEARDLVTALAEHLARLMRDRHSRRFYAGLLWRVARQELRPAVLVTQIERALAEAKEGWASRPGALLATRLAA